LAIKAEAALACWPRVFINSVVFSAFIVRAGSVAQPAIVLCSGGLG
jgi:hypothetical protein